MKPRIPVFGIGTVGLLIWIEGPILYQLCVLWLQESEYAQGLVLMALAAYLVWDRRREVPWKGGIERPKCWWGGLLMLNAGLMSMVVGHAATEFFSQRLSMVMVLWGILGYAIGPAAFRQLWEPAVLMMLAVPLPAVVVDAVTLPMKTLVSRLSADCLTAWGYSVVRYGNILDFHDMRLEVVSACSGIRSFFALLAITIVLCADMRSNWKRLFLLLLLVPIVILSNTLRIVSTAIAGLHFPQHSIESYDGYAGWTAFALAFGLVYWLRRWINGGKGGIEAEGRGG
ncbi:MAG: exosortase/archaeosortase family protein [Thermodesulfobacteriota bacterium]